MKLVGLWGPELETSDVAVGRMVSHSHTQKMRSLRRRGRKSRSTLMCTHTNKETNKETIRETYEEINK